MVGPAEVRDLFGGKGLFRRWAHYSEADGVAPLTLAVETEMEPGSYAGLHAQPDQHELLYILSGAGKFTITLPGTGQGGGETYEVKQGDALLAPAGASFALANPGREWLRYLAVKCKAKF